jgi:hypothetical protein
MWELILISVPFFFQSSDTIKTDQQISYKAIHTLNLNYKLYESISATISEQPKLVWQLFLRFPNIQVQHLFIF